MQLAGLDVKAPKSKKDIEGQISNADHFFMPAQNEGFDVGSATELDDDVGSRLPNWS